MTGIQYSQLLRTRALAPRRQGCPQTTGLQLQVLRTRALAPRRQGYNTDNYCARPLAPRRQGCPQTARATIIAHTAEGPCIILSYYHIIRRDTLKLSPATWPTGTPATSWSGARGRGRRQLELHTWMGGAGFHPETYSVARMTVHWPGMALTAVAVLCRQDGADNYWKCATHWLAAPGFMRGGIVPSETATADEPFYRKRQCSGKVAADQPTT